MTEIPSANTPLYHHPLPAIEAWLKHVGCQQDEANPGLWYLKQPQWQAEVELEVEDIEVRWTASSGTTVHRSFPYGLSRLDVERAIMAGP